MAREARETPPEMSADEALAGLAAAGSAGLLAAAFAFQHLGGLAPCEMCVWQRWPHALALALGLLMLAPALRGLRTLRAAGVLAMATAAGLGLWHVGVEQGWLPGPGACAGGQAGGLSTEALLDSILAAPVVRCDEVAWAFAGISMAGWQAIGAMALAALWGLSLALGRDQGSSSASQ